MKIVKVEAGHYSYPLEVPIENGLYTWSKYDIIVVKLSTDDGIEGIGWVKGGGPVITTIFELEPIILNQNPFQYEKIWNMMYRPKLTGRKGLATRAISCIDIAIWDLIGKYTNRPIYELLGGYRDRVPAYIAGGYYKKGKGISGLIEEMEENIAQGAKAVKMKIGKLSIAEDLERIKEVRKVIGPDVQLLVDANNAYTPFEALEMSRRAEEFRIFWLEEPVHPDDLPGLKRVAQKSNVRIATGENEYTQFGFRDLIVNDTVDVINADAQIAGGISEWKKIADFARAFNVQVAPHGSQEIHVHLVAAISNGLFVEYYTRKNMNAFLGGQMFLEPLKFENGYVIPPSKPGLGVELDYSFLNKYKC